MLNYAIIFFIIALIAAVLGLGVIAGLARCPSRHAGQKTCVECLPGSAVDAER